MESTQQLQVTCQFELPIGYTDAQKNVHRIITMQRVKACDIEGCYSDLELKGLRGEQLNISAENPAGTMVAMGAVYKFFAYLFGRVVTGFGDLADAQINRKLFLDLYQVDFNFLIAKYNELNGGEEAVEGKVPFVG